VVGVGAEGERWEVADHIEVTLGREKMEEMGRESGLFLGLRKK